MGSVTVSLEQERKQMVTRYNGRQKASPIQAHHVTVKTSSLKNKREKGSKYFYKGHV